MQGVHYALPGVLIANGVSPLEPFHRHSPADHIVAILSHFVRKSYKIIRRTRACAKSVLHVTDADTTAWPFIRQDLKPRVHAVRVEE